MSPADGRAWRAFVKVADTLVADFDIIDFLETLAQTGVDLLGVSACGILLADQTGRLNLVAASTEQARILELSQLQNAEGPCMDAYRTLTVVTCPDLTAAGGRWPNFAPAALDAGFRAVHAVPMRLREQAVGAFNLFGAEAGALDAEATELGQALADVATIGILHERAVRRHEVVTEQLQVALNSRIVIEQAKGVLAERLHLDIDEAFATLRGYARQRNLKLAEVARAVAAGELDITPPAASPSGS
ncbi:MAG TPA: GAF and ANTAR domain-containing protein [Streptosporangiaceae bacterium]